MGRGPLTGVQVAGGLGLGCAAGWEPAKSPPFPPLCSPRPVSSLQTRPAAWIRMAGEGPWGLCWAGTGLPWPLPPHLWGPLPHCSGALMGLPKAEGSMENYLPGSAVHEESTGPRKRVLEGRGREAPGWGGS